MLHHTWDAVKCRVVKNKCQNLQYFLFRSSKFSSILCLTMRIFCIIFGVFQLKFFNYSAQYHFSIEKLWKVEMPVRLLAFLNSFHISYVLVGSEIFTKGQEFRKFHTKISHFSVSLQPKAKTWKNFGLSSNLLNRSDNYISI